MPLCYILAVMVGCTKGLGEPKNKIAIALWREVVMTEKMEIVNGPGRWSLAIGMFEPNSTVTFSLKRGEDVRQAKAVVTGLHLQSYADDRTRLLVQGYSEDNALTPHGMALRAFFKAQYDLNKREGELEVTSWY